MRYQKAKGEVCSKEGCSSPVRSRGLCSKHYDHAIRSRTCPRCGDRSALRSSLCRKCFLETKDVLPEKKTCAKCREEKPAEAFSTRKDKRGNRKFRSSCKSCENKAAKDYRQSFSPEDWAERARESKRREKERLDADPVRKQRLSVRQSARTLGFDPDEMEFRFRENGNTCESCGKPGSFEKRVVLDHCHETGEFRGFLCSPCNFVAGHSFDDPNILRKVADYLERSK